MLQLTCAPLLCLALPFSSAAPIQEKPGLLLIDKEGQTKLVELEGLSLSDPRQRNAWRVQPVGFAPQASDQAEPAERQILVTLANADNLRGELAASSGETLRLKLIGGVEIPIPIDHITRIDYGGGVGSGRLLNLAAPAEGDRLFRRTLGELDSIDGSFDSFVEAGIQFRSNALGLRIFAWEEVAVLMIEDLGGSGSTASQAGLPVILDLLGNSRLRGQLLGLEAAGCRLEVAGQAHLFVWEAVEELLVDDGSLRFLGDLPALKEEGAGQIFGDEYELVWPHVSNRCVWKAGPLRCAGRIYRRGIGTHAPTKVSWEVPAGTLLLRGLVGIDDSALFNEPEYRGAVIFRVHVDGKLAWESSLISGGAQPVGMPSIDLRNAKLVTLEADMAGAYQGDRANWLELVFVR